MISVVVPCYNEEKNIKRLTERFANVEEKLRSGGFELILVDNGSKDSTSGEIDVAIETYPYIRKVTVPVNQGYGYGILQGLEACRGEWLGWIHADLQLPPEAFLSIAGRIDADISNTKRYFKGRRHNRPIFDRFFTAAMGCFESVYLGKPLWDINAQPTLIHRSLYEKMNNPPYDFSLDLYGYYMARKLGYAIVRIPVTQSERTEGTSSWNHGMSDRIKLIKRTLSFSRNLKRAFKKEGNP